MLIFLLVVISMCLTLELPCLRLCLVVVINMYQARELPIVPRSAQVGDNMFIWVVRLLVLPKRLVGMLTFT